MGRILAIDYGMRRCGVAVTDPLCLIANPLDTIATNEILKYVTNYVATNQVSTIILGKPTQMNGTPSQSWPAIEDFSVKLGEVLPGVEIKFVDERFTSKMASAAIAQSDLPKHKRQEKGLIDRTSAVIILQSYLEFL